MTNVTSLHNTEMAETLAEEISSCKCTQQNCAATEFISGWGFLIKQCVCACVCVLPEDSLLAQKAVQGFGLQPQVQVTCHFCVQVGKLHLWMERVTDRAPML